MTVHNTRNLPVVSTLAYNGQAISARQEMLSLTDMWRAAGSPDGRGPSDWRALPDTARFVEFVSDTGIAGKSGNELFKVVRGGTSPGTWAHWQIGLAYAKYLSPEFHMWCNEVVRARMEGGHSGAAPAATRQIQRDAAMVFRAYRGIGKLIGLDPNQSALAANRAAINTTGVDVLATMGSTHLVAPQQEALLTPTDIGVRLGGKSGKVVNQLLARRGFQTEMRDGKKRPYWTPTPAGEPFAVFLDTNKKQQDGTPVRQLKWTANIVRELGEAA